MRKLYKSRHDVKLDGVCGGIAEYLSVDPSIVRLIFMLLMFKGIGFVAYILCMFIIPRETEVLTAHYKDSP